MRTTVLKLVEDLSRAAAFPEPVFEFGARRAEGQEHLPAIASMFPNVHFVGADMQPGPGVDQLEDLHALSLPDDSIGTVLLLDTIEHVREPWRAVEEITRCLKPGGILVMTSVMYFPVHAHPEDYWRFTEKGFGVLIDGLDPIVVQAVGHPDLPHTLAALASKGPIEPGLRATLAATVRSWAATDATSWKERALMLLPPFVIAPAYRVYGALQTRRNRNRFPPV
jgi:SAM-dependent methyltransferase